MANFTINSLAKSVLKEEDALIKSDANGALTKTTYGDLKKDIVSTASVPKETDSIVLNSEFGNFINNHSTSYGAIIDLSFELKVTTKPTNLGLPIIKHNFMIYGQHTFPAIILRTNGVYEAAAITFTSAGIYSRSGLSVGDTLMVSATFGGYLN